MSTFSLTAIRLLRCCRLRDDRAKLEAKNSRMDQWLRELREQVVDANKSADDAKKAALQQVEQAKRRRNVESTVQITALALSSLVLCVACMCIESITTVRQETALFQSHIAMLETKVNVKRDKIARERKEASDVSIACAPAASGCSCFCSINDQRDVYFLHRLLLLKHTSWRAHEMSCEAQLQPKMPRTTPFVLSRMN